MKNQYFGDINDFHKYSLLRWLLDSESGCRQISVCWMLTPDDQRGDGGRTGYLTEPSKWRPLDPELFDHLHSSVRVDGRRDVSVVDELRIIPNARYFAEVLEDGPRERREYFDRFWPVARGVDTIFFDPDNGLPVKSTPAGRRGSAKYLYWGELRTAFKLAGSVIVYQHFPRRSRREYVCARAREIRQQLPSAITLCAYSSSVAFFVVATKERAPRLGRRLREVPSIGLRFWSDNP